MSTKMGRTAASVLAFPVALACALAPAARAQGVAQSTDQVAPQGGSVAEQTVAVMNKLWGRHPGLRANHAKGVVVEGSFTPAEAGAKLSKAALFRGGPVPVTARFSDATGIPDVADGSALARPHGIAVRFHTPGGQEMDMVLNTLSSFPVATGEEFRDMLVAVAASGPGAAKPTALDRFFAEHPAAPRALATAPMPASLARVAFNGLNAFVFVDETGKRQPFRIRLLPAEGAQHIEAAEGAKRPPNVLMDDLQTRLSSGPVRFRFMAQLAAPGDQTKDPTQPWPESRQVVELGTIAFTKVKADGAAFAKEVVFMPTNLPDGIEPSDDPLIEARVQTYAVSYGLRSQ